jgi:hypothetical protein
MLFLVSFVLAVFFDISNNVLPQLRPNSPSTVMDHGYWRQYRVCYPPFNWSLPLGLNNVTLPLFWRQPENSRHFQDTNASDHCGVVQLVENGNVYQPFSSISNVTHFINTKMPPRTAAIPEFDSLLILTGHWGSYFQHFFDNLGPQIAVALDVLGPEAVNLTVIADLSPLFPNTARVWRRAGFTNVVPSTPHHDYSAKIVAFVESAPRVHPAFFEKLRELLRLPVRRATKIVWISRKRSNSYYAQRFILNEKAIVAILIKMYGKRRVVMYNHLKRGFDETINLFAEAKVIIGAHGGGMYNQFFAPRECVTVEIMPVRANGLYPGQGSYKSTPSFSHMAV